MTTPKPLHVSVRAYTAPPAGDYYEDRDHRPFIELCAGSPVAAEPRAAQHGETPCTRENGDTVWIASNLLP